MKSFAEHANAIFDQATQDYHLRNSVDASMMNPYQHGSIEYDLYKKNWIDVVQWHLEDIIRDPDIDAAKALEIKRRIDHLNQERTDLVEKIDTYFLDLFKNVTPLPNASINTESPAWAIDRLSILAIKIYHMWEEVNRIDANQEHLMRCRAKLNILMEQRNDLSTAIDHLLNDILEGRKYMKVYRQMKMYNDPSLNPVLYNKEKNNG